MQFTRDQQADLSIRSIERGAIRIGEATLTASFALTTEDIVRDWPVQEIAGLEVTQLEPILAAQPEMIVVGTGWQHQFPPRELMFALARRGIGLEVMDTPAACRTINILLGEGRRVAALLIMD